MADTTRVRSQFDVEMQLGRGWVRTALRALAERGLLFPPPPPLPPDAEIVVDDVQIVFEPEDWDLRIDLTVGGISIPVLANVELSDDGTNLIVTNSVTTDVTTIPFDVLSGLAAPPVMIKLPGNDDHDACLALLANLDLQEVPQNEEPRPEGDPVPPRGDPLLAQSFLLLDVDLAVGLGQATFPRLANDVWHTQLRAENGSHPLPDDENPIGTWRVVSCAPQSGRIRLTLVGEVPIDLWPDATVTVDVYLIPATVDGAITFTIDVDTDVDTGILGDIFGGLVVGLVGLLLGVLTGGALLPFAGAGFVAGIVVVEVAEVVVEGVVKQQVLATFDGEPVPAVLSCQDFVVVEAIPAAGDHGIALGVLDAIPRSVTIATTDPDKLHHRHVQVVTDYGAATIDGNGLIFEGVARAAEAFEPVLATLFDQRRASDGVLIGLLYRVQDGSAIELVLPDVLARAADDELVPPFKLVPVPTGADTHLRGGRLPIVCLTPIAIRRANTIITDIRFSTGLELTVPETIMLQDAGAFVLPGLQLIHPSNGEPYYRSAPDSEVDNNFEQLPQF